MKGKKCDAVHPTRKAKCWSKVHGSEESHWAAVVGPNGTLQKVQWREPAPTPKPRQK